MKKSNLIIVISTFLIVVGIFFGSVFTDYDDIISTTITTITAIIGAVALYIQFKKDKEINQASFIMEFHQNFYEHEENTRLLKILDKKFSGHKIKKFTEEENLEDILSYLSWIRILCGFLKKKIFTYETIDEVFGYKFFMITNNKDVQRIELCKYPDTYKIVYRIHKEWTKYRKKHDISLIMEKEDLSKTNEYKNMFNKI